MSVVSHVHKLRDKFLSKNGSEPNTLLIDQYYGGRLILELSEHNNYYSRTVSTGTRLEDLVDGKLMGLKVMVIKNHEMLPVIEVMEVMVRPC